MNIKLLKLLFQLLILMIIVDRSMSQCGIRWRGTCNRRSKANDIKTVRDHKTSLIGYRLLLIPQNTIDKRPSKESSNANRLWKNKK